MSVFPFFVQLGASTARHLEMLCSKICCLRLWPSVQLLPSSFVGGADVELGTDTAGCIAMAGRRTEIDVVSPSSMSS